MSLSLYSPLLFCFGFKQNKKKSKKIGLNREIEYGLQPVCNSNKIRQKVNDALIVYTLLQKFEQRSKKKIFTPLDPRLD